MSQTPPNRGTRALNSGAKTTGFGDAFVQGEGAPRQPLSATRPLKIPPPLLKDAVSARIAETKRELDYVRHLVDLFRPFVNVLRLAELLNVAPPEEVIKEVPEVPEEAPEEAPEEVIKEEEEEVPPPPPSERALWELKVASLRVAPGKRPLALAIAEKIRDNAKLQQRIQITLHQYSEAASGHAKALKFFNTATSSSPEDAWDLLEQLGIERLKGKAYAICGFFDNYKDDSVLGQVFPPPKSPQQPRLNLNNTAQQRQSSATRPLSRDALPPKKTGFLETLKGIFGN